MAELTEEIRQGMVIRRMLAIHRAVARLDRGEHADACREDRNAAWIHAAVEFAAVGVIESLGASFDDEGLELACARMRAAAIQAMGDELGRIQLEAN